MPCFYNVLVFVVQVPVSSLPLYIDRLRNDGRKSGHRRNLTDADIARLVEAVDKRREVKRDEEGKFTAPSSDGMDSSAKDTARIIGTSERKVEKTRTILDHAEPEVKKEEVGLSAS